MFTFELSFLLLSHFLFFSCLCGNSLSPFALSCLVRGGVEAMNGTPSMFSHGTQILSFPLPFVTLFPKVTLSCRGFSLCLFSFCSHVCLPLGQS